MKALIDVFRMDEIAPKTRARIIIKLGVAINMQHGGSITAALVFELVTILDPGNEIFEDKHFIRMAKQ